MLQKKAIRRPDKVKGCEQCLNRKDDFYQDEVNPNITRCYCKARHVDVDAELMSRYCDFFVLNPEYRQPREENRYGL
jgi:hypothetical protein